MGDRRSLAGCCKTRVAAVPGIGSYVKAATETRKGNIFEEVLAACALADQDELGRFPAANVEAPLSEIVGREMKIPSFSFHLNELSGRDRGDILKKLAKSADLGIGSMNL